MSYFAAAAVRGPKGWSAAELDLSGAADVEEVADRLREVDPDAEVSLLFVEADDTYLVIMRLDYGEDLRIFGSDSVFADETRLGALLLGDVATPVARISGNDVLTMPDESAEEERAGAPEEAEETAGPGESGRPAVEPDIDPVGDADLLADLDVPASRLLALCAHEGMLPSDVTAEICQAIGCGDEVEELREV
ncbi:MAG: tRNA adenosine deaminase-associated protein [Micromonosporaceae bacterium]